MIERTRDAYGATIWLARGGARNDLSTVHWHELPNVVAGLTASDARTVLIDMIVVGRNGLALNALAAQ